MNINALRDVDNDAGFYAAACAADPNANNWTGCAVFVSADAGATYTQAFSVTSETAMGVTTDVLPNFFGGNIPDELSHVNVRLSHGDLSSTTNAGLLAGTNAAVIGDEILLFRDATLESDGTYTLRGFLRGRRGSEYAMKQHAIGDRFVLVNLSSMVHVAQSTADIGIPKLYKAVSNGMTLDSASEREFTNEGCGLKPYAPVHLGGGRNAAGDVILKWVRRNRISGEWRDDVEVTMSEPVEKYKVQIFAVPSDGVDFNLAVRTTYDVMSPTLTYLASEQVADFGGLQSTVYFRVYQVGSVGYGHPADGSV